MMQTALPADPVPRRLQSVARERLSSFAALMITGPRQSGKTTLSRLLQPAASHFSLEDPDTRAYALEDPRGFRAGLSDGAILDEVQRVPSLLSGRPGRNRSRFMAEGSRLNDGGTMMAPET